ncbi:MGMT family protein [Candidatus Palauibacter sp.]|uniref:MGMT family protein n=1 Tax=Candidatus Palauibacter sp. TaxID=3101350 RepID=UPI003B01DD88
MASDAHRRIFDVVARIPAGRVATYGQVARLAGLGGQARLVGYALHMADRPLPWHRVINARGEISTRADSYSETLQYRLLAAEGVVFDAQGRIPLERFRWHGEDAPVDPGGEGS